MIQITPRVEGDRFEIAISEAQHSIYYQWSGPASLPAPRNHDFALLGALAWAMRRGGPVHVRGAVDARLLANVEKFSEIWATWRPDLFRVVQASADDERAPALAAPDRGHAFALSGGLDSVFALMQNAGRADGRRTRTPSVAFLMDWRGDANEAGGAWAARARAHAQCIADRFGAPFFTCATNWRRFSVNFFLDHALGIIAAAHCLNGLTAGCVLAADAMHVDEYKLAPLGNNHTTNPLLSSSAFEVLNYGGAYRRMDKMRLVSAHPDLLEQVVVCHERPAARANCGACEKCVRSGFELFVLTGRTEPFMAAPPSPWRLAWMKPMAESSLVFWREMRRRWPDGHSGLRAGVDTLMWRSVLQQQAWMRALKALELTLRRTRAPR